MRPKLRFALWLLIAIFVASAGLAQAECTTSFLRKFGGDSNGAGHLSEPRDVAIDSKGNAWVADTSHIRVQEFNSNGEFVAQFGAVWAEGIALDSEGNVWLAGSSKIYKYSSKGELLSSFVLGSATDLAFDPSGNIWVAEANSDRIQKLNTKGEVLQTVGKFGTGNGEFSSPEAITVDSEGNVLVADTGNNRVQEFNSAGEFVRKYSGEGANALSSPRGIAVDSEGRVWVSDSANNLIERFSSKGAYQAQFGSFGPNDGQFWEPRGLAISGSNIWVADTKNDRVQELSCL